MNNNTVTSYGIPSIGTSGEIPMKYRDIDSELRFDDILPKRVRHINSVNILDCALYVS